MGKDKQRTVGILMFDDVEVLDFAGPFEVFSLPEDHMGNKIFNVITIAEACKTIVAKNGLKIVPDYTLADHPELDVLVVPGGDGADLVMIHNPTIIKWIAQQYHKVELTLSICTGAFLLAKAGLLDGKQATTHWMDIERLSYQFPAVEVLEDSRFVDASGNTNQLVTSAGISAGIDASLYCVAKLVGEAVAQHTARRMEYDYTPPS